MNLITDTEARDRIEAIFAAAKLAGGTQKRGTKRITGTGPFACSDAHGACIATFTYGSQFMKKASKRDGWVGYYEAGALAHEEFQAL